ncbi:MAG: hypothetical protein N4A71_01405 [Carboxylicivirga sp.]|jgi:hypothetical protein|nr:hypothetical protein [Carboxylicivirga sp.]MCT4646809.1 hypothetical protein [Carboxylicivirga sp.]
MVQDIFTYLVVAWAFYQVVIFFYRIFRPMPGKSACETGSCGCNAKKELFGAIKSGKYPTLIN